jgi:glycosyltransferase involved in cell wall biosynthesis
MRVLYSFPHKIGADRICYTAWQQVNGLAKAGVDVLLFPGAVSRPLPRSVRVDPTLAWGKLRIPYKLVGKLRALALHDRIVARRLPKLARQIDVVHVWPCAALETIEVCKQLGIPTVLERPNAHTRLCYEVVAAECRRIGIKAPHHDYEANEHVLAKEELEFASTDYLLCASDFAEQSFIVRGYPESRILRHRYGFDETKFFPREASAPDRRFTALFVGVDPVRKGHHLALEAWLRSSASTTGQFLTAGDLPDEYKKRFADKLSHPSIVQLGHRNDIPQLMRSADILLMPSIEEGFALVCAEAIGSGCVPLASNACTEMCKHMENSLVHQVGDVETLREHLNSVFENPELLAKLRAGALRSANEWTWDKAGESLAKAYASALARHLRLRCDAPVNTTQSQAARHACINTISLPVQGARYGRR